MTDFEHIDAQFIDTLELTGIIDAYEYVLRKLIQDSLPKEEVYEKCARYLLEYKKLLLENNIRVEYDDRDEKMNYKIRESVTKKIPITIILGDKEKENGNISFRRYGKEETITVSKEDFITLIKNEIKNYK